MLSQKPFAIVVVGFFGVTAGGVWIYRQFFSEKQEMKRFERRALEARELIQLQRQARERRNQEEEFKHST